MSACIIIETILHMLPSQFLYSRVIYVVFPFLDLAASENIFQIFDNSDTALLKALHSRLCWVLATGQRHRIGIIRIFYVPEVVCAGLDGFEVVCAKLDGLVGALPRSY